MNMGRFLPLALCILIKIDSYISYVLFFGCYLARLGLRQVGLPVPNLNIVAKPPSTDITEEKPEVPNKIMVRESTRNQWRTTGEGTQGADRASDAYFCKHTHTHTHGFCFCSLSVALCPFPPSKNTCLEFDQEKPHVRNLSARNSGVGNGCANFMGAWHILVLSAGKPPCP